MRSLRFIFISIITFLFVTNVVFLRKAIAVLLCGVLSFNSTSCYSFLDNYGKADAAAPPNPSSSHVDVVPKQEQKLAVCAFGVCIDLPKIPIPGLTAPGGDIFGTVKAAIAKQIGESLGVGSPLLLDQNTAYPDVSDQVKDFHPKQLTVSSAEDLQKPLSPGDYSIFVIAYCTQFSIHAPGQGLPYKLAPLMGKQAPAISALLARGTLQGIAPSTLNADAWRIQAGLPLKQWPSQDQALIHQIIPEYEKGLEGDYLQQIENTYNQFRLVPGIPSFNDLLTQSGAPGQLVLQLRQARQVLSNQTISAERLPNMLYEPTGDGLPRVLPAAKDSSPSHWAEVKPGIFARFTVIEGNLGKNLFEFRVTPKAIAAINNSATVATKDLDKNLQVSNATDQAFVPVLLGLVVGFIGYSISSPAQALISAIPNISSSKDKPLTIYLGGAGMNGSYISDQIKALKEVGVQNVVEGKFTTGEKFDVIDIVLWLTTHQEADDPLYNLNSLGIPDSGNTPLNFIGYSYGSLIAAHSAIYYATDGRKVGKLVLIGSPIAKSFLEELKSNPNIEEVIVVYLTQYGDQIYAGMPWSELALLGLDIPGLENDQKISLGHFYYALDSDDGKKRRRDLATKLWKAGLR